MPTPKQKTVSEANKSDLMIDIICDLIVKDVVKNPKISISSEDAIDMRSRFNKLDRVSDMWYELQEAKGK